MVAPAASYRFRVDQGATFSRRVTWKNPDGTAVNLTGYTAALQVRATLDAATPTLELTTANSRITLGGAAGTIDFLVDATTMTAVPAGQYVYDLELTAANGTKTRLLMGDFEVRREVTR